ncbi:MAG: glycosyltransferase, partial [Bacteroidota bacterium]
FDDTLKLLKNYSFKQRNIQLTVLDLEFNVGHQKAILQGMLYAMNTDNDCDCFIILDSDGQDDPSCIEELLNVKNSDVVYVKRGKRKENPLFKLYYYLYRLLFVFVSGRKMDFGNFSRINRKVVRSALHHGYVHYPSFLSKQKVKFDFIKVDRLKRIGGNSKMNFFSLLHHALRSFIEYAEELLVICMRSFIFLCVVLLIFGSNVLYKKVFTDQAIAGWASTILVGLLTGIIVLISTFFIGALLLKIASREKNYQPTQLYHKIDNN